MEEGGKSDLQAYLTFRIKRRGKKHLHDHLIFHVIGLIFTGLRPWSCSCVKPNKAYVSRILEARNIYHMTYAAH